MARLDKLIQEYIHDPYFVREKYTDPSVCTKCGVIFHEGKFEWTGVTPQAASTMVCPACRRIDDNYEGGRVLLEGSFLEDHQNEIMNTIRNAEESEKRTRPLERIIGVDVSANKIQITTTYEHIARRIGASVRRAFKGELKLQYSEREKFVRVYWRRD